MIFGNKEQPVQNARAAFCVGFPMFLCLIGEEHNRRKQRPFTVLQGNSIYSLEVQITESKISKLREALNIKLFLLT